MKPRCLNFYRAKGYPLFYKGEAIAVLGMFSEKKLSPADFEILGVFSDELAKELSSLFDAAKFLAIKSIKSTRQIC